MLKLRTLTQASVFLWILTIPMSLALHWNKSAGLVHGILVDYRIPTLSLSSILLVISLIFCLIQKQIPKKTIIIAIMATVIFQCMFALYQFTFQRSLTGYLPFGEVDLSNAQVVKSTFFNGTIYKLPYGTTVHPNILAGFVVICFLLLLTQELINIPRKYLALFFLFAALICFLTQSLNASIALLIGIGIWSLQKRGIRLNRALKLVILVIPILSFLLFTPATMSRSTNPSIARRAQLQTIATQMILSHPISGIGWNNFTYFEEDYGYVAGSLRFLQPPHNIFVLLVSELGILGWMILLIIVASIWKLNSKFLPIAGTIVLISSFDHYFLTLSTGRMLLILCLLVYLLVGRKPRVEV